MRLRRYLNPLFAVVLLLNLISMIVAPGSAAAQDKPNLTYFALGDSYASGHGLPDDNRDRDPCRRSESSYPYLVRNTLRQTYSITEENFHHFACSGATAGAYEPDPPDSEYPPEKDFSYQVDKAYVYLIERQRAGNTDPVLVTISIGANDIGVGGRETRWNFLPVIGNSANGYLKHLDEKEAVISSALTSAIDGLLAYENTFILLLDYPHPLPDGLFSENCRQITGTITCIDAGNYYIQRMNRIVTNQFVRINRPDRLHVVPLQDRFSSHPSSCNSTGTGIGSWFQPGEGQPTGIEPGFFNPIEVGKALLDLCVHPNALGHQAIADAVVDRARTMLPDPATTPPLEESPSLAEPPAQGSDWRPLDLGAPFGPYGHEIGAVFTVTLADGTNLGTCTLEGDAAAEGLLACHVDAPPDTEITVTLDVTTITPEYLPVMNPVTFRTPSVSDNYPGAVYFKEAPREWCENGNDPDALYCIPEDVPSVVMDIGAHGPNGHEIGAQFSVTTESGEYLGSCTLEGEAAEPYPLSCWVSVPRNTTVVVTLDVTTITPGYAPVENPLFFDTSTNPGLSSQWGVFFDIVPQETPSTDESSDDIVIDPNTGADADPGAVEAPPASTQNPPPTEMDPEIADNAPDENAMPGEGNDWVPMDIGAYGSYGLAIGAQFAVTTEDGTFLGSCVLEGDAAAPYPQTCRVSVPRYTTVVVTLDVNSITPGYAPVENPLYFDTSSNPGAASHWGVAFQIEPQESTGGDGDVPDPNSDSNNDEGPSDVFIVPGNGSGPVGGDVPEFITSPGNGSGPVGGDVPETDINQGSGSGVVDIALITRDPASGGLLTGTCFVLVNYSNEGCDRNSDGQVTFAAIPFGIYTVHQTQTPAGYPTIEDFEIHVEAPGPMAGPLGFIVKQASEQNAPNTRNVSVVFLDMATYERVVPGACVELVGASIVGCDQGLTDGQVDFVDVPAGGPYDLSFSNLPAGSEVSSPLTVTINAGPGYPANVMVFVLLSWSGSDAGSVTIGSGASIAASSAPASASSGAMGSIAEYTVLMTFRGCPEGFLPDGDDPFSVCTIPLDAPDASLVGEWGESLIPITSLERQYNGEYVYYASSDHGYSLELTGLEPVLRDGFVIYGVDDQDGSSYIAMLDDGEIREIYVFYYYE